MNFKQRATLVAAAVAVFVIADAQRAHAQQFELLHSFAACPAEGCGTTGDAAYPNAEVVTGGSVTRTFIAGPDGWYYGTSSGGGRGWGTVFRVDTGGAVEIVHRFPGEGPGGCGPAGIGFSAGGVLYVMGRGCPNLFGPVAIFRVMNATAEMVHEFTADGFGSPNALVASTTGTFYIGSGTPPFAPTRYQRWNETDGTLTLLPVNGHGPMRALADGHVYVRDYFCFLVPFSDIYACASDRLIRLDDGAEIYLPDSESVGTTDTLADDNFLVGPDGNLYGSTLHQGAHRIYRLTSDGTYTFLPGSDGLWPLGFAVDGSAYGRTDAEGAGTLSRLTGGVQMPVHAFNGLDGNGAFSQFVRGADGHLYGLRGEGGE